MLTLNKFSLLLAGAVLILSCSKVLEKEPQAAVGVNVAFESVSKIEASLNGVYDAAQSGFYINTDGSNTVRGYPFGSANIQQGDVRGEDILNIAAFFEVTYQNNYSTTSPNNVNLWSNLYFLINKANVFIEGVRDATNRGVVTKASADAFEAHARFLRAMAHHELVIHFARPYRDNNGMNPGVPYRDTAVTSISTVNTIRSQPRMRVDSVYMKILQDLDFAEANLSDNRPVTKAATGPAIALKMRVKLHMGDWAGVIAEGNKLVPATIPVLTPTNLKPWTQVISPIGGWSLTETPDGPFTNNTSIESMFSIRHHSLDNPSTNGSLPAMFGAAGPTPFAGRGLLAISPVIWNNSAWKCDDKRRSTLTTPGTNANNTSLIANIFSTKYRKFTDMDDYAPQIRYAEVILNLAEAEARIASNVSDRAVNLLNLIRNRSLNNPLTEQFTAASFATSNQLVAAILLERRIEFLAEGKRWGDIHRNAVDPDFTTGGIPAKVASRSSGLSLYNCGGSVTTSQVAIPYSDYRFIWPIPAEEIAQNPIILQNPNY